MTIISTAKGRTSSPSRSKRVSSARVHGKMDKSFTVHSRMAPADEELNEQSGGELNDEGDAERKERKKRETAVRKSVLEKHPWVSKEDFSPTSVRCLGCNQIKFLDKRREYYTTAWDKHVFRCATIKADYFAKGLEMPFESLVAEVGREAAEKVRAEREEDRARGIALQLTSDPNWIKPARIPKGKRCAASPEVNTGNSSISTPSFPSPRAVSPLRLRLKLSKRLTSRISSRNSGSKPTSRTSATPRVACSPSSSPPEAVEIENVPYHETLAYRIQRALPRVAASRGLYYCCGAFRSNRTEHQLAHQLGYIYDY